MMVYSPALILKLLNGCVDSLNAAVKALEK